MSGRWTVWFLEKGLSKAVYDQHKQDVEQLVSKSTWRDLYRIYVDFRLWKEGKVYRTSRLERGTLYHRTSTSCSGTDQHSCVESVHLSCKSYQGHCCLIGRCYVWFAAQIAGLLDGLI